FSSSQGSVVHRSRHSTIAGKKREENMESRTIRYGVTAFAALLLALGGSASSQAQQLAHDPGVRNDGDPGAGKQYPGLSDPLQKLFETGQAEFVKQDEVVADGLGPRMNLDSCGGCHAQPNVGGSTPVPNPQFSVSVCFAFYAVHKCNDEEHHLGGGAYT